MSLACWIMCSTMMLFSSISDMIDSGLLTMKKERCDTYDVGDNRFTKVKHGYTRLRSMYINIRQCRSSVAMHNLAHLDVFSRTRWIARYICPFWNPQIVDANKTHPCSKSHASSDLATVRRTVLELIGEVVHLWAEEKALSTKERQNNDLKLKWGDVKLESRASNPCVTFLWAFTGSTYG